MSAPTSLINENHGSIDVLFGGTDPWPSQNKSHATAKWIGTFKRPLDIPKYRPVWGYERWARTAPCDPRPSCTEMRRAFLFYYQTFSQFKCHFIFKKLFEGCKKVMPTVQRSCNDWCSPSALRHRVYTHRAAAPDYTASGGTPPPSYTPRGGGGRAASLGEGFYIFFILNECIEHDPPLLSIFT